MTEQQLYNALRVLVNNRVYPDTAPANTPMPYILYSQVGGQSVNFLTSDTTDKKNARIKVTIWGTTRLQVNNLARQVENTLVPLDVTVEGAFIARYESELNIYGTQQDFSMWMEG
jgi:hypothetical protein